ncbi:MAG: tRNA (adenosine(37)-N6)-threonylcarbamoyltransferase complex transferase subunit TsaD [Patescibacteria group bacterium]|nr:tRNA (adenosine(37)-N6)-threonylcarbamoyltransferase complex transferase subunit TsaD [Patescibacteria group bacterium]
MFILGIESSCDDTGVAIVKNGKEVLINLISSQEKIHAKFGGVVPEVASRKHMEMIFPLVDEALTRAGLTYKQIDAIAVTVTPGLLGSLLVGVNAAKVLGYLWGKPVISVNHLLGHIYAGELGGRLVFPLVALVASGGHSEFVLMTKHGDYKYLGGTRDDAAGEAFDKAARVLGLGYPGGSAIAKVAKRGGASLPRPLSASAQIDFSFSGLKTAVARAKGGKAELAYEFQEAVTDVLIDNFTKAIKKYKPKMILMGGGVSANKVLRAKLESLAADFGVKLILPEMKYCTDNAAMIGAAAYYIRSPKQDKWYNAEVIV